MDAGAGVTVEVWWGRASQAAHAATTDLDAVERSRLDAYLRAEDRARFLVGVTMVRRLLGRRFSLPPARVRLDRACAECGKPHGKVRADGVELSVTHSGELVGVAIADVPVGIDVEQIDRGIEVDAVARVALAPDEIALLERAEDKPAAFTEYWTRKEAVLKALGTGLRTDPRTVGVPAGMQVVQLPTEPSYRAALAVVTEEPPVVQTFSF